MAVRFPLPDPITEQVNVEPANPAVGWLMKIVAPVGFGNDTTGNGDLLAIYAEDGTEAVAFDTYGDVTFRAPTGIGNPFLSLSSVDSGKQVALIGGGSGYLAIHNDEVDMNAESADGSFVAFRVLITGGNAATVLMPHLPTADPHRVGQLYTTAGALMVSAG